MTQPTSITISCSDCRLQHTDACADCVVSFLLDHQPQDAVVLDADQARALHLLGRARLVPRLRHLSA